MFTSNNQLELELALLGLPVEGHTLRYRLAKCDASFTVVMLYTIYNGG